MTGKPSYDPGLDDTSDASLLTLIDQLPAFVIWLCMLALVAALLGGAAWWWR